MDLALKSTQITDFCAVDLQISKIQQITDSLKILAKIPDSSCQEILIMDTKIMYFGSLWSVFVGMLAQMLKNK